MPPENEIPAPPKKGMFSKPAPQPAGPDTGEVTSEINSLSRRLRLLEEGSTNMRRFVQVNEENLINRNKHVSAEIKTISSDIIEIRKEMQELKDKFQLMIKELQSVARKEEVKVLEKYINMWNPIRFVSQNEVEQIVNDAIEKKKQNQGNKDG